MRRVLILLLVLGLAAPTAIASTYYLSPDVPTDLGGTTWLPWQIVRKDAAGFSLKLALPPGTAIDSVHLRCDGRWLLSVEAPAELPPGSGAWFHPADVILYDGVLYTLFFDHVAAGLSGAADVDAAFLVAGDASDLVLGFESPTTAGAATYDPADLVRWAGGSFSAYLDASATLPPVRLSSNVTAADVWGAATVVSFDVPTTLGATTYVPDELVSWNGTAWASFDLYAAWPGSSRVDAFSFLPGPGSVGNTLRVNKSALTPGDLTLNWSAATSAGAEDYGIYEGTIGAWYGHAAKDCSDGGTPLVEDVTPQAADSYYLVVPLNPDAEGYYGPDSSGFERPVGTPACRAVQDLSCP